MSSKQVKYLVIKTEEPGGLFESSRTLPQMVLKAFPNGGYSGFKPMYDSLIQDAELIENDGRITIKGKKCKFLIDLRSEKKRHYEKQFFLFDEIGTKGKKNTAADAVEFIKIFSKGRVVPQESDVKLGYKNFFKKMLGKKTLYFDATPEIISALRFIDVNSIKKDEKGYYSASWYQSILMPPEDFEITTNSYQLTIY